jgi:hypothetical protein
MTYCPFNEIELTRFQDIANPMGKACYECMDIECIHNCNPDAFNPYYCEELEE